MSISILAAIKGTLLSTYGANFNSGTLVIYAGTPPANADAALSSNPVLGTLTFSATAFAAPSAGSMAADAISGRDAALARVDNLESQITKLQGELDAKG